MHVDRQAEMDQAEAEWDGRQVSTMDERKLYLKGDAQYDYLHKNHPLKAGKFEGNILNGDYLIQKGADESRLHDQSAHPTDAAMYEEGGEFTPVDQRVKLRGDRGLRGFNDESKMVRSDLDHGALRWYIEDQRTYEYAPDAGQMLGKRSCYDLLGNSIDRAHPSDLNNMAGGKRRDEALQEERNRRDKSLYLFEGLNPADVEMNKSLTGSQMMIRAQDDSIGLPTHPHLYPGDHLPHGHKTAADMESRQM